MTFRASEFTHVRDRDCTLEIAAMLASLHGSQLATLPPCDPTVLFEVARLNKLLMLLPRQAGQLPPGCEALVPLLDQARLRVLLLNRQGLRLGAEITAQLNKAGVRHLVLKGPLQQMLLYGDALRKPAGDIDLLIRPQDRAAATAILRRAGFAPTERAMASWWTHFLGEQHFECPGSPVVLDLHHGLQQPGLPRPRGLTGFFDRAETLTYDGVTHSVLSPSDRCLLASISLLKGFLAAEPAGGAVADLDAALRKLGPAEHTALPEIAHQIGLGRSLALATHIVDACLGSIHASAFGASPLPHLAPCDLRDMAFQPWRNGLPWPRRSRILAALCGPDPVRFATEAGRSALSIGYRRLLDRVAASRRTEQESAQ